MSNVYANGLEISGEAVSVQTIAAFPDVCFTPPENPATPPGVPVPYPSFGVGGDTEKGTGTVFIGGKTVNIKNKSDLSKSSGTEAGSTAKKGLITSKNTGKEQFHSWSGDVKFDGEPVVRFTDLATNNHASPQGNTPPWLHKALAAPGVPIAGPRCPCCDGPAHMNQLDADGNLFPTMSEEEYYEEPHAAMQEANRTALANAYGRLDARMAQFGAMPGTAAGVPAVLQSIQQAEADVSRIQGDINARESNQSKLRGALRNRSCENVHDEPDSGCATYFRTNFPPGRINPNQDRGRYLGFNSEFKEAYLAAYDKANGTAISDLDSDKREIAHMTPINAGGCPTSPNNLVPKAALDKRCQDVDEIQTTLQSQRQRLN